ncbi:MAG: DUF262 domain-containing protein [Magnetococcales bacterium]|nr:DUF262 domain-containing protein [Magnetococcales bacterium]
MAGQFDTEDLDVEEENQEEEVVVSYDIASYPSDFTLSGIAKMWEDGDIVIPDYQREFVWSIRQSSLLIDSFLCGLPVPPVFFYIDDKKKNVVIDGQQRILSVVFFFDGYFGKESTHGKRQVFRLTGLGEQNKYNNLKFDELDEVAQRELKQSVLRAINIRQLTPDGESTSAYHIFERLNTGGTPLKPQEIRNCVFRGGFNTLLKDANNDINWRKIIGKDYLDKHQKDVELILRIFALVGAMDNYEKPMKEFLNRAMKKHDSGTTKKATNFFKIFSRVTEAVVNSLGPKPFHLRGPLNISALDSVMCVLIENNSKLPSIDLKSGYAQLCEDEGFQEYTKTNTTDTKVVISRMLVVKQYLVG